MLAPDAERQGFVRIINESSEAGTVRITAVDDGGTAASPIEVRLAASQSLHFNSDDLANGNTAKGINSIGPPRQGHWRLAVETALDDVQVLAFVRTRAGFLTAMHDTLPRDDQGRLVVRMLNPGSNRNQESSLRLVNTGGSAERVSISGVDDQGNTGGPVTLTLPARQSRTISAFDLEQGAQGLTGRLGDRAGKWRLRVTAGQSVVGMSLLTTAIGPITNLSTAGVPAATAMTPTNPGGQGNSFADAINLAVDGRISASIDPAGESDYYSIRISEAGTLTVYTSGDLDTRGYLYDGSERQLASNDDGSASDDVNFRIQREVDAGTYYVRVEAYLRDVTGDYTIHAEFDASTEPPTRDYYGAFALSDPDGPTVPLNGFAFGLATNESTRAEAERVAVSNCEANIVAGDSCRVYQRFSTGECLVLYAGLGGGLVTWENGPRGELEDIDLAARQACEIEATDCTYITTACNDGDYSGVAPKTLRQASRHKR